MLESGLDQAAGLRRLLAPAPLALMAFPLPPAASLHWVARLAHALRRIGRSPVVVDGARGALAAAFGLRPRLELIDLLEGRQSFDAIAQATADGVHVLRADLGLEAFAASGEPAARLLRAFASLAHGFDQLLLAMPARELASIADPAATVPVVALGPAPAAAVEAYALLKELAVDFGWRRCACVATGFDDFAQAREAHGRLAAAAGRFLRLELPLAGWLPAAAAADAASTHTAQALLQLTAETAGAGAGGSACTPPRAH